MPGTITCSACGTVLGVPKGGMPKDGLSCNWCGYITLPPPEPPGADTVRRAVTAAEADPTPAADVPASIPEHRDDDDDGRPYELPHEPPKYKPCTSCGKHIGIAATVCSFCGFDSTTNKKVERVYEPIDRTFESGWSLSQRLTVFWVFQAINVVTLIFGLIVGGSLITPVCAAVFYVALQAFLLGSYESIRIRRNKKGQAEVISAWRIAFIPMAPKRINWKEREGVAFGHYDATSIVDWIMILVLLPFFIVPAIIWFIYVLRSDRYYTALARDRGYPETYLYRGMNEARAKEIAQLTSDATGLPLTTKL